MKTKNEPILNKIRTYSTDSLTNTLTLSIILSLILITILPASSQNRLDITKEYIN